MEWVLTYTFVILFTTTIMMILKTNSTKNLKGKLLVTLERMINISFTSNIHKQKKLHKTNQNQKKKKNVLVCPFTKDSNFIVEIAENIALAPLELFEDWVDDTFSSISSTSDDTATTKTHIKKPLAARWLNAGLSGQDSPKILRAGLKRMRDSKYFLVEDTHRIEEELLMKKKALEDPARYPFVSVAEPDSLDAQREVLELFLDYLPRRYPDLYAVCEHNNDDKEKSITVKPLGMTFFVKDYWDTRPLDLCERIVQEDLVIMRPDKGDDTYRMAAATVVFSFNELPEKLGQNVNFIHAPVPGYMKHLTKTLHFTFDRLQPGRPLWRNNWGIAPTGTLDEPLYGSTDAHQHRLMKKVDEAVVKSKFLKVEYQTIRRLPRTNCLLFTVKTMADPMYSLEKVPKAAACLASSIRGMSSAMRVYKGIEDDVTGEAVLSYLDSIQ